MKYLKSLIINENRKQDDEKNSCLSIILNRNKFKYDNIQFDNDILKLKISYLSIGKGTKILPFIKHRSFHYKFWIDFNNKILFDKNLLGKSYHLNNDELNKIYNKYKKFIK